jgi:predicted DsbA family dithiol-disulfide isomerase
MNQLETITAEDTAPKIAVRVDVWSEILCPWCWIGKRRLEEAVHSLGMAEEVEIRYHSFELVSRTAERLSHPEMVRRRYGGQVDFRARVAPLLRMAAELGLTFNFERAIVSPTFDGHRLIHLAAEFERETEMLERLHRAVFAEGRDIADHPTLRELAIEVGLPAEAVTGVLGSDAYAEAVEADEARARAYGVQGVPFFVFDDRYGVSGAQPLAVFQEALRRARADRAAERAIASGAAVCDDELCLPETD